MTSPESKMPSALLVDDDRPSLTALSEWLDREGFRVATAETLEKARAQLGDTAPDLVLLDLQLPDGTALDLLPEVEKRPNTEVVFITGHATVDSAVEALRGGAADYLTKPVDLRRLRQVLANVRRTLALREEITDLRDQLRTLGRFGRLVGGSSEMQHVYDMITRVAPTEATVLVTGETGTGKELVAETVHALSKRARSPFLPINCGAVPPNLIESELFGHERGSFTGAQRKHRGIFERAHGGTLFLDEITEMPLELQVKLLRVLETGRFTRIGGDEAVEADVRLIAATNRDARKAVGEGKLREDLLYRLLVFPIELPPLRGRSGDVELLANYFLDAENRRAATEKRFSPAALDRLRLHSWPGNVRELENVVERSFIMSPGDTIDAEHLPFEGAVPAGEPSTEIKVPVGLSIAEAERRLILATLDHLRGDKPKAAEVLGISLKTLYNRLNSYKSS